MPAPKKYDAETQQRAVRMYHDRLAQGDVSLLAARTEVGELLDINQSTLRNWIRREEAAAGGGSAKVAEAGETTEQEVARLRRERTGLDHLARYRRRSAPVRQIRPARNPAVGHHAGHSHTPPPRAWWFPAPLRAVPPRSRSARPPPPTAPPSADPAGPGGPPGLVRGQERRYWLSTRARSSPLPCRGPGGSPRGAPRASRRHAPGTSPSPRGSASRFLLGWLVVGESNTDAPGWTKGTGPPRRTESASTSIVKTAGHTHDERVTVSGFLASRGGNRSLNHPGLGRPMTAACTRGVRRGGTR